jgi:hypothetical protein
MLAQLNIDCQALGGFFVRIRPDFKPPDKTLRDYERHADGAVDIIRYQSCALPALIADKYC